VGTRLLDAFASVTFMDSSPGMIEQAKGKLAGAPNARALVYDLARQDAGSLRFDCVFTSMVLHHIRDTQLILSRFYGILNKGGRLIVVDLDKDDGSFHASEAGFDGHNGFDQREFACLMGKAGFRDIRIETFYRGEKEINGIQAAYSLLAARADK